MHRHSEVEGKRTSTGVSRLNVEIGGDDDVTISREKYLNLHRLWQNQEQYIDQKLREIQYKDDYTEFLMKNYEIQAREIISLKQSIREMSKSVKKLEAEVKELKLDSSDQRQRSDYLENVCEALREENRQLTELLEQISEEAAQPNLNSTFVLSESSSRPEAEGFPNCSRVAGLQIRRSLSRMSDDFREERALDQKEVHHEGPQMQDFPTLFDVEIFNNDDSSFSYEDSETVSVRSDQKPVDVESGLNISGKTSRLSWLSRRLRRNKVTPVGN